MQASVPVVDSPDKRKTFVFNLEPYDPETIKCIVLSKSDEYGKARMYFNDPDCAPKDEVFFAILDMVQMEIKIDRFGIKKYESVEAYMSAIGRSKTSWMESVTKWL